MGVYSTTDKGNVTMTQNGAFAQFQFPESTEVAFAASLRAEH